LYPEIHLKSTSNEKVKESNLLKETTGLMTKLRAKAKVPLNKQSDRTVLYSPLVVQNILSCQ